MLKLCLYINKRKSDLFLKEAGVWWVDELSSPSTKMSFNGPGKPQLLKSVKQVNEQNSLLNVLFFSNKLALLCYLISHHLDIYSLLHPQKKDKVDR